MNDDKKVKLDFKNLSLTNNQMDMLLLAEGIANQTMLVDVLINILIEAKLTSEKELSTLLQAKIKQMNKNIQKDVEEATAKDKKAKEKILGDFLRATKPQGEA